MSGNGFMDGSKYCKTCDTTKPLSEFYRKGAGRVGYHHLCKECMKTYYRDKWHTRTEDDKQKRRVRFRGWYDQLRKEIISEYGGKCACCGETTVEFLSVDHVNGGGRKHREQLGGGTAFFLWLKDHGFPKDGYRLLCMNCNWARGRYGYCPHERKA